MSMSEEQRILLATDFSTPAARAYAYAARLAKALSAKVVILNVLEGPPGLDREFPVNPEGERSPAESDCDQELRGRQPCRLDHDGGTPRI